MTPYVLRDVGMIACVCATAVVVGLGCLACEVWIRAEGKTESESRCESKTLGNLFANVPENKVEESLETILTMPNVRIERIISHGHASPDGFWYDQDQNEFVVLLKGAARLRFEDGEIDVQPGSFINIPAHERHRVEWTTPSEPTIWLRVFYG